MPPQLFSCFQLLIRSSFPVSYVETWQQRAKDRPIARYWGYGILPVFRSLKTTPKAVALPFGPDSDLAAGVKGT
jgi:hypothetical protein